MTASRRQGPLGLDDWLIHFDSTKGDEIHWPQHQYPKGGFAPGPEGLWLMPQANAPANQTQASSSKPTALIIIGSGQDEMRDKVRYKKDKFFEAAALKAFSQYTKGHTVKLVFVKNKVEMLKLIQSKSWDVVVYFGHGVLTSQELMPGYGQTLGGETLKRDEFAAALKKSNPKNVYMFGCRAGWTGHARALSKDLPGTSVSATFNELDVDWVQRGKGKTMTENKFIMKEGLTEYKDGFQMKDGKKTKKRRQEMSDLISTDGDLFDEQLIDQ